MKDPRLQGMKSKIEKELTRIKEAEDKYRRILRTIEMVENTASESEVEELLDHLFEYINSLDEPEDVKIYN